MSKINELKNYTVIAEEEIPEVNGKGYVLSHNKTKARVLIIENDDDNKVFTIGFRTPPNDDTGIPHILEHSVLCGSRKYPVKDPFVELAKGSLNTFLNAMTYSDKTVYPIASCNLQDFENLMQVYLDAVFYPNIYIHDEIMRQEGWHYELEAADAELKINGVVYNEMKGVFSSAESQMYRAIERILLPDTAYAYESGGDPAAIPELTQERFEAFHETYYHPSNSYIYLYGDADMVKELEFIDEEYLSHFEYKDVDSSIGLQTPFSEMKEAEEFFSISETDDEENNTFLTYNKITGLSTDKKTSTAMSILEYVLMDAPGAPLKTALVDAGIGEDIFSSYDDGVQQTTFSIIAKNANKVDKNRFVGIIEATLSDLCGENGDDKVLNKKSVEAAINMFEFKHKEGNFGRYPKGLMLGLNAFNSWLYDDGKALEFFKLNDVYAELKSELHTGYFTRLISEKLLHNNFGAMVIVSPKKGLDRERDEAEKARLRAYKASLDEEELKKLIADTAALKAYQETPSPAEDMEKVPLLNISDIEKSVKDLKNRCCTIDGVPVICHDIFTNGIGYLELMYDINDMNEELIPYAALLSQIFKYVDTEHYSYSELGSELNFHLGGVAFSTGAVGKVEKGEYISFFSIRTKAVYDKIPKAMELIEEILFTSHLDDKKRLKEIIAEEKAGLKTDLTASGHMTAAQRAMSYISPVYVFKERTEGVDYFSFLCELDREFDSRSDEIVEKLNAALSEITRKGALKISYTGDNDAVGEYADVIEHFIGMNQEGPVAANGAKAPLSIKNEGFKTASQVQYVAVAGDFEAAGYKYTGALSVLQVIFSYDYLWINVRVKGGAYGCMCSFTKNGYSYMTSYRDPNLMETYEIYKNAYKYVADFDCSDRDMTKYLIGAIAKLDAPMTPSAAGSYSFLCYLAGITDEMRQQERDEILSCDKYRIRELAPIVQSITDSGIICAVGGEDKIEAAKEHFDHILSEF